MPKTHDTPSMQLAVELIELLYRGAGAEEFAQWQTDAEARIGADADRPAFLEAMRLATAMRTRVDLLEQRERGLLAVIESAQDLTSRLERNELLSVIVARARNLLGSDLAWLSTHDPDSGEFRVLVADGAVSHRVAKMVTRRDAGVAGVVMSTKLPFTTPDYLHDTRFAHDGALDDTFRDEGIDALAGVPLIWEGEVVGLLFVADRYNRTHLAPSIAILCTLATYCAVALRNARDFERVNAALARADQARADLEHTLRGIQAAAEAHEQLTTLLARGAPLASLCQSIARWFGGSMLVLDEAGHVVSQGHAHKDPDSCAARYEPNGVHAMDVSRALRSSRQVGRSVVAFTESGEACRVMAVIGGDDILGATLLFHRSDLDDLAVRTFERGSSVVGIVLLSQERAEAAKHRSESALLRSLVAQRQDEPAVMANHAERHGLLLTQPLSLMLMRLDEPSASYGARALRIAVPSAGMLVDDIDGLVVVLCSTTKALDLKQSVSTWARRELGAARFRGVMSRPVSSSAEIPALYATLRRAVGVLDRIGIQGHIVDQNELALYSTLFETHDRSSLADYLDSIIGPVLAHDRKRSTELANTLLSYLDCNRNSKTTAQKLGIHVNTVRQRLATIEELLGHWGRAGRALEIHVALRLWHLSTPVD
ncbi:helix-turn-helix domain-containing protein [Caldimonas sp. KR1-144]|uniref:helix-turn-helix domain-containing protein n=1 Tax=Caldimonas sp. KR1-144 TaxID=3400911 RepID=UPI003C026A14